MGRQSHSFGRYCLACVSLRSQLVTARLFAPPTEIQTEANRRRTPERSGNEATPEAERDGLCSIASAELTEQPASVRLDGVFGQEQLAADLAVGLPLAHSAEDLHLPFGQGRLTIG